ncbi:MAG: phosphoenolpyruvate mutase [Candidatus Aminicenantes bacterium]|nr:phosphoenolpyruvate mutase [Candidatus Aminicenantes bacterium]
MKKSTQLRRMLESPGVEFIMEAHNGLSAKIVEETGFKGIWASGLSISAALGVRDNNEASWTQVLEVCEFMSDATSIPILLDGDTGFGNFNSFRRLVAKLGQRNIAGVCIEDKIFPKTNSFIGGEKQPLANIDEFSGKIKAGKDLQQDPDFVIVARVEALIAGWGLDEAIKRANAYANAGADAILIHSKIVSFDEVELFLKHWDNKKPVVIVPTMYYQTPTQKFRDYGVSLVIWANHTLRAAITNMQKIVRQIHEEQSLINIQKKIVPVKEIFRIQNVIEYKEAEDLYLPKKKSYKSIILAASKGTNFGSLTDDRPKAMIKIGSDTILSKIIKTLNSRDIKDIGVVVGFKKEAVNLPNLKYIVNEKYSQYGLLYSIFQAKEAFFGDLILLFGDVLFEEDILRRLMINYEDIVLAVDPSIQYHLDQVKDLVEGGISYSEEFGKDNICRVKNIRSLKKEEVSRDVNGEFIGILKLSERGSGIFYKEMTELEKKRPEVLKKWDLNDFINHLIGKKHEVFLEYFKGKWKDIDSIEDLTYLINLQSME